MLREPIAALAAKVPETKEDADKVLSEASTLLALVEQKESEAAREIMEIERRLARETRSQIFECRALVGVLGKYFAARFGKMPRRAAKQRIDLRSGELLRTVSQFIELDAPKEQEALRKMNESELLKGFVQMEFKLKKNEARQGLRNRKTGPELRRAGVRLGRRTKFTVAPKHTVSQLVRQGNSITRENKKDERTE